MLSQEEQQCYAMLSVFRDGFTREAAEDVAAASLPLLASLMDKSMLYRTASGRYGILEVLRQYAGEHLMTSPEQHDRVRERHGVYYLILLRRLEPALKGPGRDAAFGQLAALEVIQQDLENIRIAWRWAVDQGKWALMHRACISLALFCDIRSRFRDGLALFGEAIATLDRQDHGAAPELLGLLLGIQGEYRSRLSVSGAREALRRSVELLEAHGPSPELALVIALSSYAVTWHTPEEIEERLTRGLDLYKSYNDPWGIAVTLGIIGENLDLALFGDRNAARKHTQQSLDLRRDIGDVWGTAIAYFTLGAIAESEGAYREAQQHYQASLDVRHALNDLNGAAHCVFRLGNIAYRIGELDQAYELHQQSVKIMNEIGAQHSIPDILVGLALIIHDQGNLVESKGLLIQARDMRRSLGDTGWAMAFNLLHLGDVSLDLGEGDLAAHYFEESLALFEQLKSADGERKARAGLDRARALSVPPCRAASGG
jgi:tetratricopeptide (TPR) repeat protein